MIFYSVFISDDATQTFAEPTHEVRPASGTLRGPSFFFHSGNFQDYSLL